MSTCTDVLRFQPRDHPDEGWLRIRTDQEERDATSYVEPPVPLNPQEEQIVHKIRKAKLFVFLRKPRHELFDEAFRPGVSQQSPGIFPPLRCELFTLASSL